MTRVRVEVFGGNLRALLHGEQSEVGQEMRRRGTLVLNEAKRLAPVDTGKLRGSLRLDVEERRDETVAIISSPLEYAVYVHEGTGIYAGRGPIRPKRAKMLAWRRGGKWHFAKQVAGQPAQPFLADALNVLPR